VNNLLRWQLSILRNFRAWQLGRAAKLEVKACCPMIGLRGADLEGYDWDHALFDYDGETRANMMLEAEAIRTIYDDASWVYRALAQWASLDGVRSSNSPPDCFVIPSVSSSGISS
jgi:hypothetical protein